MSYLAWRESSLADASVADYDGGVGERGSASRSHSRWVSGPTAPRLHLITTAGPRHPADLVRNGIPKHTR